MVDVIVVRLLDKVSYRQEIDWHGCRWMCFESGDSEAEAHPSRFMQRVADWESTMRELSS